MTPTRYARLAHAIVQALQEYEQDLGPTDQVTVAMLVAWLCSRSPRAGKLKISKSQNPKSKNRTRL